MIDIGGLEKVIKNLKSVELQASKEGAFDMMVTHVRNCKHKCGTVHCVGGWYAVSCIGEFGKDGVLDYHDGAELMARHLGFGGRYDLEDFLRVCPKLWGNKNGALVFSDVDAYDETGFSGVVKQFEGMLERVKNLNGVLK